MKNTLSYQAYLKSPYKSNKYTTYFEIYDDLFKKYRGRKITFVEIGVLKGGSLFMWRNFFGPEARIIGVDLNPNAKKWEKEGFEIFIGSQSDEKFWENFKETVGMIDVVLDDGGHTYEQQIITTEMLLENIKNDGLLVVEDTHTSYMEKFGSKKYTFVEYVKIFIDKINNRFDNFDKASADYRVWSIQAYDSLIAFKVNRNASNLLSEKTNNFGKDDSAIDYRYDDNKYSAIDYRYDDNKSVNALNKVIRVFKFANRIPGSRRLATLLQRYVVRGRTQKKIKQFFR